MEIEDILKEREKSHGNFLRVSETSQKLKFEALMATSSKIESYKRESIEMILHKIARIICGDSNHLDSWQDIEGYARLVSNELKKNKN
jgi:hypothetical protein